MGGPAHPQKLLYPVFLVHDLPLPLHQACCRTSALQLWLWLEGSLGIWVVALGKGTGVKSVPASETGHCGSTHLLYRTCGMWWVRVCLGLGSAPYQPLYPFLLCLLQRNDINLCQGSWVQTNELCRYLEGSQREGQEWVRRVTPKRA